MNRIELIALIQRAFFLKSNGNSTPSKKRAASADSGPEAASTYLLRRDLHPGRASSFRKLSRAARIERGERPLKYDVPGRREAKVAAKEKARS